MWLPARISDWLELRKAQAKVREINTHYASKIAVARKEKNTDLEEQLYAEWQFDRDGWLDPVAARTSERLIATAQSYGISVPPRTTETGDWERSNATGDWYLEHDAAAKIRKEVREEQRAREEVTRARITLALAALGFILAALSLYVRQKEPDPCPRNYYRNDSGACAFALYPQSDNTGGQH